MTSRVGHLAVQFELINRPIALDDPITFDSTFDYVHLQDLAAH